MDFGGAGGITRRALFFFATAAGWLQLRGIAAQKMNPTTESTKPNPHTVVWDKDRLDAVHEQADKAQRIRRMFDAIAPSYELVNSVFSFRRDAAWRRTMVRLARVQPGDAVLDIACGTGNVLRAFHRRAPACSRLVGGDFSHGMLTRALTASTDSLRWFEGDGMKLPVADASFDITACAFGVRNFQSLEQGLAEMFRVLKPGGRAVILEFSRPGNRLVRSVHELYSRRIMPWLASVVSRDKTGAYRYLPQSVVSFVSPQQICDLLGDAGFANVVATPLTFGVVTVYVATKERP